MDTEKAFPMIFIIPPSHHFQIKAFPPTIKRGSPFFLFVFERNKMKFHLLFSTTALVVWTASCFQTPPLQSSSRVGGGGGGLSSSSPFNHNHQHQAVMSSSVLDIEETAERDIMTMDEWATACGVQRCDGFQLVPTNQEDEPLDVGVMTAVDLPAESPVIFVPNEMMLSANRAKDEIGTLPEAEELFAKLGVREQIPRFYLFLKVLKEYELGEESPWFPWLNSLPRYFSNGASMTHFCCSNCLPPLVGSLALMERTRFRQYFKALNLHCDFLSDEIKVHKQLAKWAYNIVYTRSFHDGHGDIKIAPLADYFNHDTEWEIQGRYDEDGNFFAYTTYDVPAGTQLRMSYTAGDNSNPSFLFARYGFLDESSPATFCKIMIDPITQELKDMGYVNERMLFYKETGEVSEEVYDVLLYQILGMTNKEHQQALYQAHMTNDYQTKQALHEQYYQQTLSALQNHVETFLHELDELSNRTVGRDLNVHPRLPLILKHNDFVKQTFLKVRENLQLQ